jgi:hypothetical protein
MRNLYAVLTGDLVSSSRLETERRLGALDAVRMRKTIFDKDLVSSNAFRGDSFQVVLSAPQKGLAVAAAIRAKMISMSERRRRLDARIAVGVGAVDFLPKDGGATGDGEAFRISGRALDGMKEENRRLAVATPWGGANEELNTEAVLLDGIVRGWTPSQGEAAYHRLMGLTQKETAKRLGATQQSISERLIGANMTAVLWALGRFEKVVEASAV